MGYSTIIDIIGSIIVGGLLMLILFRTNSSAVENTYNYGNDLNAQQSLEIISRVIDYDFAKIGYCNYNGQFPDYTKAIKYADSTNFEFYADMNNDKVLDSVYYNLGSTSQLSKTPNPNDRILYRTVYLNTGPEVTPFTGITVFKLSYYDTTGNLMSFPITHPENISRIVVYLKTESAAPIDGAYASAFLESTKYVAYNINQR